MKNNTGNIDVTDCHSFDLLSLKRGGAFYVLGVPCIWFSIDFWNFKAVDL